MFNARMRPMYRSGLLAFALIGLAIHAAPPVNAGEPTRSLNQIGRWWGVGYSDGYHACGQRGFEALANGPLSDRSGAGCHQHRPCSGWSRRHGTPSVCDAAVPTPCSSMPVVPGCGDGLNWAKAFSLNHPSSGCDAVTDHTASGECCDDVGCDGYLLSANDELGLDSSLKLGSNSSHAVSPPSWMMSASDALGTPKSTIGEQPAVAKPTTQIANRPAAAEADRPRRPGYPTRRVRRL